MKSKLRITINKDSHSISESELNAIHLYWKCDTNFNFQFSASEISKSLSKSSAKFLDFLNENSRCSRTDVCCKECGAELEVASRADLIRSMKKGMQNLTCEQCLLILEEKRLNEADDFLLERMIDRQKQKVELYNMQASDLVSAYAVAKYHYHNPDEQNGIISSIDSLLPYGLYANQSMSRGAIERLEAMGFLHPYLRRDSQSFTIKDLKLNIDFNYASFFLLWPNSNQTDVVALKQLEDYIRMPSFIKSNHSALQYLAFEIELHECLEYLKYCLNNPALTYYKSSNLLEVLSTCLEKYAVTQVFKFIWVAVKQSSGRQVYQVSEQDRRKAFNLIPKEILKAYDRVQRDSTSAHHYDRPRELPRSLLSHALFEDILGNEFYFKNHEGEKIEFLAGYKTSARSKEIFFLTANDNFTFNSKKAKYFDTIDLAEEAAFKTKENAIKEEWCPVVCDATGHQLTVWDFSKS